MFTNWLTATETSHRSRENQFHSPPDVLVEIALPTYTRFPAHSAILSAHSGYLRAAIIRASEMGKLSETPIFVPNITIEHFSPLLTYMYTGFLDLNFENIFGVLLATHLLHMPRALEICRDFLAQTQQPTEFYSSAVPVIPPQSTLTSNVIKPIASKASNLGLNFISAPKNSSNLLVQSRETPFKTFPSEEPKNLTVLEVSEKSAVKKEEIQKVPNPPKSTSSLVSPAATRKVETSTNDMSENEKVIIDIASCDGPVKFRRVLNDAFEKNRKQTSEPSCSGVLSDMKYQSSMFNSFHQQMIRNIDEQYKQKSSVTSGGEESENSQHSSDVFTCVYCNLTFKSKYCYQKHAKRHLNPLSTVAKSDCESSDGESRKNSAKEPTAVSVTGKRDMKPLDMNVQYYPCKTCGCKFPSYYFVHKHRKLCHPEIGDGNSLPPRNEMDNINRQEETVTKVNIESN